MLAYRNEDGNYRLTVLGYRATRAVLPLTIADGFGRLLRDLLAIDDDKSLLNQWGVLDHLLVLDLLSERASGPRVTGKQIFDLVDSWMESHSGSVPLLYRKWIKGGEDASKALEVLGSLGVDIPKRQRTPDDWARKVAYCALARSIILYERGQGMSTDDIERRWKIVGLEGVEERWRDEMLWLLNGIGQLCEIRCFYYYLIEEWRTTPEQVHEVSRQLKKMRSQVFDLLENVKYCSALGPVLRSMKRTRKSDGPGVGLQTIRRLEESGIKTLRQLSQYTLEDLTNLGVRKNLAKQLESYLKRRRE
jgi:hypothetical protein